MKQVIRIYMTTSKHFYKIVDIVSDLSYPKKIRIDKEEFVSLQKKSIPLKLIQRVSNYCPQLELCKISILPMLSKDLSNSFIFDRIDIFKIAKTKIVKNMIGRRVNIEMLLKIKNK